METKLTARADDLCDPRAGGGVPHRQGGPLTCKSPRGGPLRFAAHRSPSLTGSAMTTAMKNWEAQAKTNSILAGSLRALEERVDAFDGILAWKAEVENEVAHLAEGVQALKEGLAAMEKKGKRDKLLGGALSALASKRSLGGVEFLLGNGCGVGLRLLFMFNRRRHDTINAQR